MLNQFSLCSFLVLLVACNGCYAESKNPPAKDAEVDLLLQGFDSSTNDSKDSLNQLLEGFNDSPVSQPSDNVDDLLKGFDSSSSENNATVEAPDARRWSLLTLSALSSSYSYQHADDSPYHGLSRFKFKLQPELRLNLAEKWDSVMSASGFYDAAYRFNGRSQYETEFIDANESEIELRELYVRGTLKESLDIKFGRQIVVWGKSDSIRVVDVLNPLDFREPGITDIEDLRLPVTMLKTDYYFSDWNLSVILIPEVRVNKMPAYGSDYYLGGNIKVPHDTPDQFGKLESALALNGVFSGWDISFHLAQVYDDQPHVSNLGKVAPELMHSKLNMLGTSTNLAIGSWLLKMELAYLKGLEFARASGEFSRADLLLGIDYSGFTNTTLSLEGVNRHLFDYDSLLENLPDNTREDEGQIALRYNATFFREKMTVVGLISTLGLGTKEGAFYRATVDYEIYQATTLLLGAIVYQSGDSPISKAFARNDRIFLDLKYSF